MDTHETYSMSIPASFTCTVLFLSVESNATAALCIYAVGYVAVMSPHEKCASETSTMVHKSPLYENVFYLLTKLVLG